MTRTALFALVLTVPFLSPLPAHAQDPQAQQQSNVPPQVQSVEDDIEDAVRRFRIGVTGGVGLDPELIMAGAHASFGPIFRPGFDFRPGFTVGVGELTTTLGISLDVLYSFPGATRTTRWRPYVGAGPNFAVSRESFETDGDDGNRFDFSDTDFKAGLNVIAGARTPNGLFFELKATAGGVTNVRLLAGFNF